MKSIRILLIAFAVLLISGHSFGNSYSYPLNCFQFSKKNTEKIHLFDTYEGLITEAGIGFDLFGPGGGPYFIYDDTDGRVELDFSFNTWDAMSAGTYYLVAQINVVPLVDNYSSGTVYYYKNSTHSYVNVAATVKVQTDGKVLISPASNIPTNPSFPTQGAIYTIFYYF